MQVCKFYFKYFGDCASTFLYFHSDIFYLHVYTIPCNCRVGRSWYYLLWS